MTFIKNNCYLLTIMLLCITFALIGTKKLENNNVFEEITVVEGDTLWGLSTHYADNIPIDKWIGKVMKLNNLSSATIQIGDELKMPLIKSLNRDDRDNDLAKLASGEDK